MIPVCEPYGCNTWACLYQDLTEIKQACLYQVLHGIGIACLYQVLIDVFGACPYQVLTSSAHTIIWINKLNPSQ